jgi:hypothetical protein
VSYIREQREFSELTLVAEVSRYLNKPPVLIASVLRSTVDGIPAILKTVNEFNELLYDHIIPRLFAEFYTLEAFTSEKDYEVELAKVPDADPGFYRVTGKKDLIANYQTDPYAARAGKSFHLDNYCFDSKPEHEFFWKCLEDKKIEKIWFTGMLTHGQSEFCIAYIDPISHTLRQYYPDFLVRQADGSYVIVEIKGDNMIDDLIVKAKEDYATQQAVGSGFTYRLIPGSKASAGLVAA